VIRGAGAGGWGEGRGGVLVEMPGGGDVGAVGYLCGVPSWVVRHVDGSTGVSNCLYKP